MLTRWRRYGVLEKRDGWTHRPLCLLAAPYSAESDEIGRDLFLRKYRHGGAHIFCVVLGGVVLLTGCGGGPKSEPLFETSPTTVGTLSQATKKASLVRDVLALRAATTSGGAEGAVSKIFIMLNRAASEKDAKRGAAMIRKQLPGLVSGFMAAEPSTRAQLLKVRLRTRAGAGVRALDLYLLARWRSLLPTFASEVARTSLTWYAVDLFGRREEAFLKASGVRMRRFMRQLSPQEFKVVDKAVREMYGHGAG